MAGLANGRFVVTYTDFSIDSVGDIRGHLFTGDGVPVGTDFGIAAGGTRQRESSVAALADGGFVVSYTTDKGNNDNDIDAVVMNANGSIRTALVHVNGNLNNTSYSSVAGLADGGFVVAWEEQPAAGGASEVRFRRFDAQGIPRDGAIGAGVLIDNVGTINADIHVAGLPDGGFVVAYTDNGWGSGADITAQVFNADGTARSIPLLVNSLNNLGIVAGNQHLPSLTVMPSGHFVAGYINASNGTQYVQAFDSSGQAVGANFNAGGSHIAGDIAALADGRVANVYSSTITDGSGDSIRSEVVEFSRTLTGTSANETIAGVDDGLLQYLEGKSGDDLMIGGPGHDHFWGGLGFDYASYGASTHGVYANLEVPLSGTFDAAGDTYNDVEGLGGTQFGDTLVGDFYDNYLGGGGGDDVLQGGYGSDLLRGGDGNDMLDGGPDGDSMGGDFGDDIYVIDDVADVVVEHLGGGTDTAWAWISYTLPAEVEKLVLVSDPAAIGATGNDLDNVLSGNSQDNILDSKLGADSMEGGVGNDIYVVDNAGDLVIEKAGQGTDAVIASISYVLPDNVENLLLAVGAGAINGTGNGLANAIGGNSGNNVIDGEAGADFMTGGDGNDTYIVDNIGDKAIENAGQGTDTVRASVDYTLSDNVENLLLLSGAASGRGNGMDNVITGNGGNNALFGGSGNDRLDGRTGNDLLDGGAGDDMAVFRYKLNDCTVLDFGAKIVVQAPDGTDTLTSVEHLQFADVTITPVDDGDPLFDSLYYLSRNSDVFQTGLPARYHYGTWGWHEGRDPNAYFDTSGYLAINKDVAAAGINPLEHYHQTGWHEGRDPSASFDTSLYLIHNPDVAAAGVDPLAHFLQTGFAEGRKAYEAVGSSIVGGFDAQYYLFHNPDVAAAGVDPLQHFNQFGSHEGRNPNAFFDAAGYLAHYTDVAAAGVNPLQHYMQFGWHEGRDPSAGFDTQGYLAANPDVGVAGVNPLDHYLQFGIYEGRTTVNDGLWH